DIRVINNNIKILQEEKANLSNLQDVAKESSPKNIENKVIQLEGKIEKNYSEIKNIMDYEKYGITYEKCVHYLDDRLRDLQPNTNYIDIVNVVGSGKFYNAYILPNMEGAKTVSKTINGITQEYTYKTVQGIKIILDDKIIYWHELDLSRLSKYIYTPTYQSPKSVFGVVCRHSDNLDRVPNRVSYGSYSLRFADLEYFGVPSNSQEKKIDSAYRLAEQLVFSTSHLSNNKVIWNNSNIPFTKEFTHSTDGLIKMPTGIPTNYVYLADRFLKFEKNLKIQVAYSQQNADTGVFYDKNSPEKTLRELVYGHLYSLDD
ncbi:MAG: hypothetical protein K2F59_01585, partial [Eubacteriales bacterium]|nr:hypothetical protein [Eubacteriales bacterium]